MLDTLINLILQLPAGILFAAVLVEFFVLSKDRREVEPAVLWLLFCAAISGVACGAVHFFLRGGSIKYAGLALVVSALASLGFWFKRQARNKGVLKLTDRFYQGNSYAPVKVPNQAFYIFGYRSMLGGAFMVAIAAVLFAAGPGGKPKSTAGSVAGTTETGKPAAGGDSATPANPSVAQNLTNPDAPAAPAVGTGTPSSETPAAPTPTPAPAEGTAATTPGTPAPAEGTTPASATPATTPAVAEGTGATPAAPTAPADTTTPAPAATPPAGTPATMPAATPGAPTPVVAPVPPAAKPAVVGESRPISKNSFFATKIRPLIQRHCVTCHGNEKQKGDLRLDTPDHIRAGAAGKAVLLAGKPAQSSFYTLMIKPLGDEDRMPPKGDGISKTDAEMIKKWIEAGADMGDGVSTASGAGVEFKVDKLSAELTAPPAALLEQLKGEGVNIRQESSDGKMIRLVFSYAGYTEGQLKLERLAPIARNIYALDLSRTVVHDADLSHVSAMVNIHHLNLDRTDIGDAGLSHLSGLTNLEVLNLYQTKVSDAGLRSLYGLKNMQKLYAWQSMVTAAGAQEIKKQIPNLMVNMGAD